jgi:queuine tRNA-ribosyltransferase
MRGSAVSTEFSFDILQRAGDSRARRGRLRTPHGTVETPAFIFCATKAAIKAMTMAQMREAQAEIVLSNTYHLMIQPGADVVEALGGLQAMTGWNGPMLTDSGGFQIFSMGHGSIADEIKGRRTPPGQAKGGGARATTLLKIEESGATFRSYLDGRKLTLTPEESVRIQKKLGADLVVQLDECTPFHVDRDYTRKSMLLSQRWGDRSLAEFARLNAHGGPASGRQAMYGIVQGGTFEDLRCESAAWTRDRDFFGTAIGGTLGGNKAQMEEVVAWTMPHIHPDRPVHLLGIGGIRDIFMGVALGIDTFDCVSPTRIARHGWALVEGAPGERINLRNTGFKIDTGPLDPRCSCYACRTASRGYVHHLLKAGEMLGAQLVSIHNVATMTRLLREVRSAIETGTLAEARRRWVADERASEEAA